MGSAIKKNKQVKGIFIAGHSEGSLIGMLAAQKVKVQGYISISGPARGIADIITEQYAQQLPKAAPMVDSLFKRLQKISRWILYRPTWRVFSGPLCSRI